MKGMYNWFDMMGTAGLLFHPDDDPEEIVRIVNGRAMFNAVEVMQLRGVIDQLFALHGEVVYEAACTSSMRLLRVGDET